MLNQVVHSEFFDSEKIVYRCTAAVGPLLDRVYSMRYRGYSKDGYIDLCGSEKFIDEYDSKINSTSYLLYSGSKAVATIRTCLYAPEKHYEVPVLDIFGKEIEATVGLDSPFIETNKFVIDPCFQKRGGIEARFHMFATVVEKALSEGAKSILIAVRPAHIRFYKMMFCHPISEVKAYPHLKFKTILLACTDLDKAMSFINEKLNRTVGQHESISRYGVC